MGTIIFLDKNGEVIHHEYGLFEKYPYDSKLVFTPEGWKTPTSFVFLKKVIINEKWKFLFFVEKSKK